MTTEDKRIGYFDVLKGFAIYMVVMGHVLTYGITGTEPSVTFRLIGSIHMPLFFFISGYFTVKETEQGFAPVSLRRRFIQLIVPMVAVSTLWIYYYPHSGLQKHLVCTFPALWGNLWKNGYWFTPVLFAIILLYQLTLPGASAIRKKQPMSGSLPFIAFAATAALLIVADSLMPGKVSNALSFKFIASYFPVFVFGGWARCNTRTFNRFATSDLGFTGSVIVLSATLIVMAYPELLPFKRTEYITLPAKTLLHASLATVATGLCLTYEKIADGHRGRLYGFWSLLGRKSLQIYLLHYFFLFPLGALRKPLIAMGLDFIPTATVAAVVALPIIGVCLCLEYTARQSRLLSLLTGIPIKNGRNKTIPRTTTTGWPLKDKKPII